MKINILAKLEEGYISPYPTLINLKNNLLVRILLIMHHIPLERTSKLLYY